MLLSNSLKNNCKVWWKAREAEYEGEIDPHTPLFINITYTKKDPHSGKIAGAQKGGWCPAWG